MLNFFRGKSLCVVLCFAVLISDRPSPVCAQPADDAAVKAPAADAPAVDAPAGRTKVPGSYLTWFIRSSGLIGLLILGLSIYFVATVIRLFLEIREEVSVPSHLLHQSEDLLQRNDLQTVYSTIQADDSILGHVLSAGLSELPYGISEAREAMDRMSESETVRLEKQISMLAVLGTLGPMIGLIGTLKGMISSFSVIAMSDVQLKASEVASGISEALLLTFEGVALSVPAIYFHALFRNRVSSISAATMVHADRLLRHIARAARMTSPTNGAASAPGTAPPWHRQRLIALRPLSEKPRPRWSDSMSLAPPTQPNLTPILDMVFQLITFFMLVINFKNASMDRSLKLPVVGSALPASTSAEDVLVLNISAEGQLMVYGEARDIDQYVEAEAATSRLTARRTMLDYRVGDPLPTTVILRADQATPFRILNRIMTTCQTNGFRQFSLKALNRVDSPE